MLIDFLVEIIQQLCIRILDLTTFFTEQIHELAILLIEFSFLLLCDRWGGIWIF